MKQHITLKQWDEITKEQKNVLWDNGFKKDWKMSIGQMIEFLGDDWWKELFVTMYDETVTTFEDGELCDVLWGIVKIKLKNKYENH